MARAVRRIGVVLALCATGCYHAAPSYSGAATQATWRSMRGAQRSSSSASAHAPAPGGGLTAEQAYELALAQSPGVAALEASADSARADIKAARQVDNPQLRFTGFNVDDVIANSTTMNIGLRMPIPRPGSVRASVDAAKQVAESEASVTEDAKRLLRAEIYKLYAQLAKHQLDLEHAARATALRAERRDRVVAREEQAVSTRLDVAMAQVSHAEATQDEAAIRTELAAVERELTRLIGVSEPVAFVADPTELRLVDIELDRDALTEQAMATRPELRAAQAEIAEAKAEAYVERSNAYPWFDWAQVQYRADAGGSPTAFGFGVALTLPIFSWNRGAIKASRARVRQREQEQRAQILAVAGEVDAALDRVEKSAERVRDVERDLLPTVEAARLEVEAALASGALDPIDAADVDARVVEAKRMHLDVLLEHREAVIDLEAAVGAPVAAPSRARP